MYGEVVENRPEELEFLGKIMVVNAAIKREMSKRNLQMKQFPNL
jgi:hypothetical protein